MKEFISKISESDKIDGTVTLAFEQRVKSRLRAKLDNNEDAGIFMQRGSVLEHGDLITTKGGFIVQVIAATELLSSIYTTDTLLLAKVCYHLGNRHIELQIKPNSAHYKHDHVLDGMVQSFGLEVISEMLPFEPEQGAYNSHSLDHGHSHEH